MKVSILIRRPAQEVYQSFVEPDRLRKFWLQDASGPLQEGATARWDFLVPGASVDCRVEKLEPGRRILLHWDKTPVEWTFTSDSDGYTVVEIEHRNLPAEEVVQSTEGFTTVLCDLKLLLETGTSPNLVRDKALLIQRG